mmetsp:Transcript_4866/g.11096  ORF Transcript_4866/g.11096 Transcript_4866/m.11096 type:complete len:88 (-) Transcript_4866:2172-2435(-)
MNEVTASEVKSPSLDRPSDNLCFNFVEELNPVPHNQRQYLNNFWQSLEPTNHLKQQGKRNSVYHSSCPCCSSTLQHLLPRGSVLCPA